MSNSQILLTLIWLVSATSAAPEGAEAQFAIVANERAPVSSLSLEEVRRIFSGKSLSYNGQTAVLVGLFVPAEESFFKATMGSSAASIRKRWAQLAFQGEGVTVPPALNSPADVAKFLASNTGSIAFLPAASVLAGMKVIKVDGRSPSDANYPIK